MIIDSVQKSLSHITTVYYTSLPHICLILYPKSLAALANSMQHVVKHKCVFRHWSECEWHKVILPTSSLSMESLEIKFLIVGIFTMLKCIFNFILVAQHLVKLLYRENNYHFANAANNDFVYSKISLCLCNNLCITFSKKTYESGSVTSVIDRVQRSGTEIRSCPMYFGGEQHLP